MKKLSVILFNLVLPVWAKSILAVIGNAIDKATNPIREQLKKLSSEFETFKQEVRASILEKVDSLIARIAAVETSQTVFKDWVISQLAGLSGSFVAIDITGEEYNDMNVADVIEKEEGGLKPNTKYRITNIGREPIRLNSELDSKLQLTNGEFLAIKTNEKGDVVSIKFGNSIEDEQRNLAIEAANTATLQYANDTFIVSDELGDYGAKKVEEICAAWLLERA
jgi:uncharacterized protein YdcH (DUF465 family)